MACVVNPRLSRTRIIASTVSSAVKRGTPCSIAELRIIAPSSSSVRFVPTVFTIACTLPVRTSAGMSLSSS